MKFLVDYVPCPGEICPFESICTMKYTANCPKHDSFRIKHPYGPHTCEWLKEREEPQ